MCVYRQQKCTALSADGARGRVPLAYSAAPALLMRAETWLTRVCVASIAPSALSTLWLCQDWHAHVQHKETCCALCT